MADEETTATSTTTTDTTTATATDQTTAPAQGTTAASSEPSSLAGVPKATHRDQFLAQLAAKRSALSDGAAAKTPAPAKGETTSTGEQEKVDPAKVDKEEEPVDDPKALEAARKLNEIALAGRRLREIRAQEAAASKARAEALAAKEQEIAKREQAASDKLKALQDAMASGSKVAILRAAGIPDSEIKGTWLFDAMQEAGRDDDETAKPAATQQAEKPLTKEEVAALLKAHDEEVRKQREQLEQQQASRVMEARKEAYFSQVQEVYDKGEHPICQAVLAPMGKHAQAFLDEYLTEHFNRTRQALTGKELLDSIEETYRKRGLAVGSAKPAKVKPAPVPAAASTRTITHAAAADAGATADAPAKRERTMHELREDGWKETEKRLAERRSARRV